jgi:hypothetical protein
MTGESPCAQRTVTALSPWARMILAAKFIEKAPHPMNLVNLGRKSLCFQSALEAAPAPGLRPRSASKALGRGEPGPDQGGRDPEGGQARDQHRSGGCILRSADLGGISGVEMVAEIFDRRVDLLERQDQARREDQCGCPARARGKNERPCRGGQGEAALGAEASLAPEDDSNPVQREAEAAAEGLVLRAKSVAAYVHRCKLPRPDAAGAAPAMRFRCRQPACPVFRGRCGSARVRRGLRRVDGRALWRCLFASARSLE